MNTHARERPIASRSWSESIAPATISLGRQYGMVWLSSASANVELIFILKRVANKDSHVPSPPSEERLIRKGLLLDCVL